MSDLELTMMRRVGELNKENARLKEAIADSYKAVDEMEKRFKELEAEFEMHPMAVENARLKAEVERLTAIVGADAIDRENGMCCDASAQVERLTKAGDAMAEAMWYGDNGRSIWVKKFAETDWAAAKEGKHS
jgi:predicted nuclease with TOPRIM domain